MSDPSGNPPTLICCTVFATEVRALCQQYWPDLSLRGLNSLLHIYPERLSGELGEVIGTELAQGRQVLLAYGDCCAQMTALQSQPGVARTAALNCCQMVLGREVYRRLEHEGAFFLMPEWARRWRTIFTQELGFSRADLSEMLRDLHTKLVYLDTGLTPIPLDELQACSEFCGLPFEIYPISLEPLKNAISAALEQLRSTGGQL